MYGLRGESGGMRTPAVGTIQLPCLLITLQLLRHSLPRAGDFISELHPRRS